ncbi:penicillin-binding protein activator [Alteromonas halophila]|uniref:Penicillin-binding protein activator LpoA n=1 Tax=Alteromonas halophila TaxID=516698 RepID=A0A918JRW8_9ALTE|nr:penicillin-binding protein activator [Alteromonas halophila]GGW96935.1 penicillin-binding protein activator LpoA [Alteromonas halophila]
MKNTGLFRLLGVTLIATVLAACAAKQTPTQRTAKPVETVTEQPAREIEDAQQKLAMARTVWQEQRDPLLRDSYLIDAADAYISTGDSKRALQIIYTLRERGVSQQLQDELNLVTAAVYIDARVAPDKLLPLVTSTQLNGKWQRRQLLLQHQLYLASNQYLNAANSKLMLDDATAETVADVWRWVNLASDSERSRASSQFPLLRPYLVLYDLLKTQGLNTTQLRESIDQFRQVYRGHPVAENLDVLIRDPASIDALDMDELVVLLPLSGRFENTGNAVKEGILSGYYRQLKSASASSLPQLRFIDTQGKPPARLIEEIGEAQWVLGPLLKDTLDALLPLLPPRVSMLALNRPIQLPKSVQASDSEDNLALLPDSALNTEENPADAEQHSSAGLLDEPLTGKQEGIQKSQGQALFFALAPEDEAYQLAEVIYAKGYRAPIVVSAQASLYQRMQSAFTERWAQLNAGRVADKRVNLTQVSFTDSASLRDGITRALDVAQSNDRISQIKYMINEEVYNMPRNRQDIDAVVVFASPQHTELLNPMVEASLLPANNARVPVYATSRSMDYDSGKNQWRDLQNVRFLDMPWMLPDHPWQPLTDQVSQIWPNRLTQSRRLFAFGVDAYNLLPDLANMHAYPQTSAQGLTGELKLKDNGVITRTLPRAIINDEEIQIITE